MLPLRSEDGQGLAEYALILTLVALVAVAALQLLGISITSFLNSVATGL
jgi:Flp pilus assembly pilin Flp